MTFEELKKELKEIKRQEALCERRYVRIRETYKRQNAPIQLKKYQRVTVVLRVTEETRKHLTDKEKTKRRNQVGNEYTVTGFFVGWYIHGDGNGELKPCFYGDVSYSRFDDIVSIKLAEHQPVGKCEKCRLYKDGFCYMAGGKDMGKRYATHKVKDGDIVCPKYEEILEGGLYEYGDASRHCPNVTVLQDAKEKKKYRVWSLNWNYYEEYNENEIWKFYTKEPNDNEDT